MAQKKRTKAAATKAAQDAAQRRRAQRAGIKIIKGTKKASAKPEFEQAKHRPKGGLGALARKVKKQKEAAKKKKKN